MPLTLLLTLAAKVGIPEKFRKLASYAFLAIAIALLIGSAIAAYNHFIISRHDDHQELQQVKVARKADNQAAVQRRTDDAREAQERQQLEESAQHGQTDTDRRLAYYRCLRVQQQARDRKQPAPSCNGPNVPSGAVPAH